MAKIKVVKTPNKKPVGNAKGSKVTKAHNSGKVHKGAPVKAMNQKRNYGVKDA